MKEKSEKVFVGILAGSLNCNVSLLKMANDLPYLSADPSNPYTFVLASVGGVRPQEYARNLLIDQFLETDCDVLWMIDEDMIYYGGPTLEQLKTPDYDICGPIQLMWDTTVDLEKGRFPSIFTCAFNRDPADPEYKMQPVWPVAGVNVTEVDGVGSGSICIRRKVLEDQRMHIEAGMKPPAFFRNVYEANGNRLRGLDIDFCFRAKDLGYRVRINWAAQIGHYKSVNLNQVEMYAKTQMQLGYDSGVKHGKATPNLQVVKDGAGSGAQEGADGSPSVERPGDREVARVGLARGL